MQKLWRKAAAEHSYTCKRVPTHTYVRTHTHTHTFIYLKAEELELEPRVVNAVRGISSLSVSRIFVALSVYVCVPVRACVCVLCVPRLHMCLCGRVLVVKQKRMKEIIEKVKIYITCAKFIGQVQYSGPRLASWNSPTFEKLLHK